MTEQILVKHVIDFLPLSLIYLLVYLLHCLISINYSYNIKELAKLLRMNPDFETVYDQSKCDINTLIGDCIYAFKYWNIITMARVS